MMKILVYSVLFMRNCVTQSKINTFYLLGLGVFALRIIVPVVLLIFGIIDLIKVITAADIDKNAEVEIKKSVKRLSEKFVLAFIVFILPTLVSIVLNVTSRESDELSIEGVCVLHATSSKCKDRVDFSYISDPGVCLENDTDTNDEDENVEVNKNYIWRIPIKIKDCSKLTDYWAEVIFYDDGESKYETDFAEQDNIRDIYLGTNSSCKNFKIGTFETHVIFSNLKQELNFDGNMYIQFELDPNVYDTENGDIREKKYTIYDLASKNFTPVNFPAGIQASFEPPENSDSEIKIIYHKN